MCVCSVLVLADGVCWLGKRQLCAGVVVVMVWSQFLPFAYACTTFAVLFLGLVEFSALCNVMLCVCLLVGRLTGWLMKS